MVHVKGYWRVRLACLIVLVLLFGGIIATSYMPRHIEQEFYGIELLMTGIDEYEILQTVTMRINGRVSYGMFASFPWFNGSIEISGYDFTINNPNSNIPFVNGFSMGGAMMHPIIYGGSTRIKSLGLLYTNEDFSSIIIQITDWVSMGGGSYQGKPSSRVIFAPATCINCALGIMFDKGWYLR